MILFPAVDVMGADAVKFSRRTGAPEVVYGPAVEMVRRWCGMGADWIHIVDLHGALALPSNAEHMAAAVKAARDFGAGVQLGGGLRSDEALEYYLGRLGVERALVATRAVRDADWLARMAERWPNRIVLSLDAYGEKLAIDGWKTTTDVTTADAIARVRGLPLAGYMYTNLHVEGAGRGVDWAAVRKFVEIADRGTVISGGVTTIEEVRSLKELGVFGVILGSALYRGSIALDRALEMRE
jgi:phosphoribosylformimino-5-aminoimidazole carboxamide ribotide isomerase